MASTVVATLAQVSSKTKKAPDLNPTTKKLITAYIASGSDISADDASYVGFIQRNPGLSVQEMITKIEPKADRKARHLHQCRIHKILRHTSAGRNLIFSGLVARVPAGGRPYWYLDMQRLIGAQATTSIVPVRSPSVQMPRMSFAKDVGAELRNGARASVADWCGIAGVGRRWHSQATVQSVQKTVKGTLAQVMRENTLAITLAQAISVETKPMIVSLIHDIVAEQFSAATPAANRAAA